MKYEEVIKLWGYNKLVEDCGTNINKANIEVSIETFNSSACSTCSYEYAAAVITDGVYRTEIPQYSFTAMLHELVALSVENASEIAINYN